MIQATSSEVAKRFGDFAQHAQHETVEVTLHGRAQVVIISAREYARLRRLDRQVYSSNELPEHLVEAICQAESTPEAVKFDDEV